MTYPCQGADDLYFSGYPAAEQEAIALCRSGCPLMEPDPETGLPRCFADAIRRKERFGVWGGHTETQLREAVDCREHGTEKGYQQHKNRGESICDPCRVGHNAYETQRKAEKRLAEAS